MPSILIPPKDRENENLSKDDLYLVIVVDDATQASVYRAMIKSGIFTPEHLKDTVAVYYYSGELGSFNFRNSKIKQKHNIVEHVVIFSLEDISSSGLIRTMLEWDLLDLDVVMVNQLMFTFYR